MDNRPIGVFDSGIGGLTVLKEINVILPGEDVIYFGDSARLPYGPRSWETVCRYSLQCARFLEEKGVKAIVVACNTASAQALETLREHLTIPVIGVIQPGGRAAARATKNGIVGIIGTEGTVQSRSYETEIRRTIPDAEIVAAACPLFVQIVEEGWENSDVAELTARKYLMDIKAHHADTLVLGCTHYPPLRDTLSKILDPSVVMVNPAYETALEAKRLLKERGLLSDKNYGGNCQFFVSDSPDKFMRIGRNIVHSLEIRRVDKVTIDQ